MNTNYKILGEKVKKQRKAKNLTISELADNLNVSVGLISNIENAKTDAFRLDLLNRMANELDLSVEELLSFNSIDFNKLIFHEEYSQEFSSSSTCADENTEIINNYIGRIIHSFLSTISEYRYEKEKIECIGEHIIDQFEVLKKLNK